MAGLARSWCQQQPQGRMQRQQQRLQQQGKTAAV
jgi:hypothetical protein